MHFFDFESGSESGSRFMRHLGSIKSDLNNFFSSNPAKIHRFVEFRLIHKANADLRGL